MGTPCRRIFYGHRQRHRCGPQDFDRFEAVYSDSELIINQVNGSFEVSNPHLAEYLTKAREAARSFDKLTLVHIPRTGNLKSNDD
ncbi:hypothetical protein Nepgr_023422 [Nepenthes gracilis]|uniref:RNase H type-1 domain-containing protein n=1 Tax=Nepenthes gracilis TaxID=150966 RepID=A0AAD3T2E8_NEPGR|nr:hypothetical protein Nepgr_023422 [Nepenthes gracilis]